MPLDPILTLMAVLFAFFLWFVWEANAYCRWERAMTPEERKRYDEEMEEWGDLGED